MSLRDKYEGMVGKHIRVLDSYETALDKGRLYKVVELRTHEICLEGNWLFTYNWLELGYGEVVDSQDEHTHVVNPENGQDGFYSYLNVLAGSIHKKNIKAGWWTGPEGENLKTCNYSSFVYMTKLGLATTEISEAMEGERKGIKDDHLPHRDMAEVECADAIIRILDYCGAKGYDIHGALFEKLDYNSQRADHKPENRVKEGGKSV